MSTLKISLCGVGAGACSSSHANFCRGTNVRGACVLHSSFATD